MGAFAREQAGHRLQPSYSLFPAPEGGEKTRLCGELRREEQLLTREVHGSRHDRRRHERGVFHLLSPLSSGSTGVAHEQRLGKSTSTSTS
jgi:hypothetical protein